MDPDDVFDRLDARWFFSSVFEPPSPELHLPLSTYPVDVDDDNRQATPPGCPKVHHKVWSWLINSVEASDTVENAVAQETKLVEEQEQSTLIAMVMAETQLQHSPPPPSTPPVPKPKSKDVEVRKKRRDRKKVKSVKNELMERRRNDLARTDYDYVRRFECCYLTGADQLYWPLLTRQTANAV